MPIWIPQAVGILAVVTFLWSYQQKKRKNIILLNAISRGLYILQYLLLGAFSGAVLDILGAASSVLAGRKDRGFIQKHPKLTMLLINAAIIGAGLAEACAIYALVIAMKLSGMMG